jgi:predicted metallo-beta-lactamase superfamily hydrolase
MSFSLALPKSGPHTHLYTETINRVRDEVAVFGHAHDTQLLNRRALSQILDWGPDIALVEGFELFVRSVSQQAHLTGRKCGSPKVKRTVLLIGLGQASANTAFGASCATGST